MPAPPIAEPHAVAAFLAGITAAGYLLARRFRWARVVSPSLLVLVLGAAASNAGLVTARSVIYDVVSGPGVSLALVWLLLSVRVRDLRRAGPGMLSAFALGVAATAAGAAAGGWFFRESFPEDFWKLAGVLTGTYSGGSLNFVAVGREVGLPDSLYGAAQASDNVLTALWFAVTLTLPVWLGRVRPMAGSGAAGRSDPGGAKGGAARPARLDPGDVSVLLALGLAVLLAARGLAVLVPVVPEVVWLTTLALGVGQLPPVGRLEGALPLGGVILHLFFGVIGVGCVGAEILRAGPGVFGFTALVVLVHGAVLFGVLALWRRGCWDIAAVASQAAIGGPSTAMALAVSRRRPDLVAPGMAVGLLGYAVGTYLGLAVAALLRAAG